MSAQPDEDFPLDDDLDDLLDEVTSAAVPAKKGKAVPLVRTAKQRQAAATAAEKKAEDEALENARTVAQSRAAMLAQIANLTIAGFTFDQIGMAIGASAEEVERMITVESQRYVRNQPALRTFVRNFISEKYAGLLESVYDQATDTNRSDQLDYHLAAIRTLKDMARLHGAEAPTQSEVKVEAAPEAVTKIVEALASGAGMGYDMSIFDSVPGEVVHEAHEQARAALEVSGNAVEESDGHDEL